MLGRKITFFCMAQGMPRPEITWFKDGIELYAHKFFQVGVNYIIYCYIIKIRVLLQTGT